MGWWVFSYEIPHSKLVLIISLFLLLLLLLPPPGTVRGLRLPYQIDGEKIGELSIRYTQNNDQNWTKALKYMLTNLKWLLAWCSKQP